MTPFASKLHHAGLSLKREGFRTLQVNLGKLCNMTCVHCHVEAGPARTAENMDQGTAEAVLKLMDRFSFHCLDLTGGAPEMNPSFRFLVSEARRRGLEVLVRSNLTLYFEPEYEDLPEYLAGQGVKVIASLPCYSKDNTDMQRGTGSFERSIRALQILNQLGYGKGGTGLELQLVYNPVGAHLPPAQSELEADYRNRLQADYGIYFNRLLTLTNMPITRYEKYLRATGTYESYVRLLEENFNACTVEHLMCRETLSVSWNGRIYDCDFNQVLGIAAGGRELSVFEPDDVEELLGRNIATGDHCYGCTAGAGSSCRGALEEPVR